MVPLPLTRGMRLDEACRVVAAVVPTGATDCALSMLDAETMKLPVGVFVIDTDSETYFGKVHSLVALKQYREATGIGTGLAVVGMTATGFTIADPTGAGMLVVVGFDAATPEVVADFVGAN